MQKSLEKIQKENRKFILEAIHGCSYEEALKETENNAEKAFIISPVYSLKIINNDRVIDIKNQLPNYS